MVVKPAVIGCLVSCAVMWPRSPADLVDNGASGERSVMSRSAARSPSVFIIVIYSHLAGAWISVGPVSTDSVLY